MHIFAHIVNILENLHIRDTVYYILCNTHYPPILVEDEMLSFASPSGHEVVATCSSKTRRKMNEDSGNEHDG